MRTAVCKQLLDPGSGAAVPLDLVGPAAALGVRGERQLQLVPLAQAGGVSRGGHEAGAGEETGRTRTAPRPAGAGSGPAPARVSGSWLSATRPRSPAACRPA